MAPKFVTPYRLSGKRGKNDAADAAAICEAVGRPNMRFVPVKEEHQQVILTLHRTRQAAPAGSIDIQLPKARLLVRGQVDLDVLQTVLTALRSR